MNLYSKSSTRSHASAEENRTRNRSKNYGPLVKRLKSKKSQRTKKFKMAKSGIDFVLYFSITTLGRKTTIKEDKKTIKATVAMVGFILLSKV